MFNPRDFQIDAMNKFEENNYRGIIEMATGTGKTFTSLMIANKFRENHKRIFLIIVVPFTHLAEQWEQVCIENSFTKVLKCYGIKQSWKFKLENKIRDFNIGISDVEVLISTYKTASSDEFNDSICEIKNNAFIIGDECHYFGINGLRENKMDNIQGRLGLSATPNRWWDEAGTDYLRNYFGNIVYKYSIEEAIKNNILTDYVYTPIVVDLTDSEAHKYDKLTKILIGMISDKNTLSQDIEEINRKRSLILSKAKNKKDLLYDIFKSKKQRDVSHTLIYCAPGEIDEITLELSRLGYRVHRFDSNVQLKDRSKILKSFSVGEIQILVAIKCLDEGVDVPSTRVAYFLASTSNPREFIQRRGRVLRKSEGKNLAEIYDFIVLPNSVSENLYKSIASKELPRFAEFSKYAINRFKSREVLMPYLKMYSIEYLMDKLPWEVYYEMVKESEEL